MIDMYELYATKVEYYEYEEQLVGLKDKLYFQQNVPLANYLNSLVSMGLL